MQNIQNVRKLTYDNFVDLLTSSVTLEKGSYICILSHFFKQTVGI